MLGELISAGTSLLGGLFGQSQARSQQRQQMQLAQQQMAMQREFAQQGVRWRVDDARQAGVHPLFALGAQTHSYSPVSVGGGSSDNSMGDAIASAGQNIGRAVQSEMTAGEREKAAAADALTLEKAGLENELLRTQIGSLKQAQLGPALPSGKTGPLAGQGDIRKYNLAHNIPIHTRPGETPAEKIEDEYGDESIINFINNNYRQIRDLIETGRAGNSLKYFGGNTLMEIARQYVRDNAPVHREKSRRPWIADQFRR